MVNSSGQIFYGGVDIENTLTTTNITNRLEKVEAGLNFILSHFGEPDASRTIAVGEKFGIEVNSIADIMYYYKKGGLVDCRINAYPNYTDSYFLYTDNFALLL